MRRRRFNGLRKFIEALLVLAFISANVYAWAMAPGPMALVTATELAIYLIH